MSGRFAPLLVACCRVAGISVWPVGTAPPAIAQETDTTLHVGVGKLDLQVPHGETMWGYTPRKNEGTLDPLMAKVFLFEDRAAERSLALVTLDTGRTPAKERMERIRTAVRGALGRRRCVLQRISHPLRTVLP